MDATMVECRRYLVRMFPWAMQIFKEKAMVAKEIGIHVFSLMGAHILYFFFSMVFHFLKFLPVILHGISLIYGMIELYLSDNSGNCDDGECGDLESDDGSEDEDDDDDMEYIILRMVVELQLIISFIIFYICLTEDSTESYLNHDQGDEGNGNCGSACIDLDQDKDHESDNTSRELKEDETDESGINNFAADDGDHEDGSDSKASGKYEEYDIGEYEKNIEENCSSEYQDDESSDGNYLAKGDSDNESSSSKTNHSNNNDNDEEGTRESSKDNGTEAIGGELSTVFEQFLSSKASSSLEGHEDDESIQFVASEGQAMEESMFITTADHEWLLVGMPNKTLTA